VGSTRTAHDGGAIQPRENNDYYGFMRRAQRAAGRRATVEDLQELVALHDELGQIIRDTVRRLRAEPECASWTEIGAALGISRQAAQKRFGGEGARKVGGQPANLR
jgi:hypothetical protein